MIMDLDERVFYLILGLVIGFFIGRITKSLKHIDETVSEVDEIIKRDHEEHSHRYDEDGYFKPPSLTQMTSQITSHGLILFFVVGIVAYSAIVSQISSNTVQDQADANSENTRTIGAITNCTAKNLGDTLDAINSRTIYSESVGQASLVQLDAQKKLIVSALEDPPLETNRVTRSLSIYLDSVNELSRLQTKTLGAQQINPYPTVEDFQRCLTREMSTQ